MRKLGVFLTCALLLTLQVFAQNTRTVTGKVTDENGKALAGVTVSATGSSKNAISNDKGAYSIQVSNNAAFLKLSFVGYSEKEVRIAGKSEIDVQLAPETNSLNDVVVVGYGVQQKKAFTGAASKVDAKEFAQLVTPSVDRQLAGRAAGVQVVTSGGDIGTPARIRIRGINSFGSQDPLIVVDGVPFITGNLAATTNSNALGDINPNDIENMEILKDGSATAIFGSRAANGVIMITTKKGDKTGGKMKVNYDATFSSSNPYKVYDLLNAYQFVDVANMKKANAGLAAIAFFGQTNTDWQRAIMNKDAVGIQQNISFSGGTAKSSYYFSLNYSDQVGTLISNKNKAYRVRFNFDNEVNKFVKVGNNLTLSRQIDNDQNNGTNALSGAMASALRMLPNVSPFNAANVTGYNVRYPIANTVGLGPNTVAVDDNYTNPLFTLNVNKQTSDKLRINNNTYVELSLAKGLKIRSAVNVDILNDYSFQSQSTLHGDGYSGKGYVYNADQQYERLVWQNYLNYNKSFGRNNVYLTAGQEAQTTQSKYVSGALTNISDEFFVKENLISGTGGTQSNGGSISRSGFQSLFARVNYDFANKYFIQSSIRRDGQSSLAPQNRFGTFPGYSAGWRISQEKFWANNAFLSKVFSEAKLKASYAVVGNPLSGFPYLSTFSAAAYGNISGMAPNLIGNSALQWERSKKYDYGTDLALFNGRVNVSVDYFLNDIDQLVLAVPTPNSAGIPGNSISQNIGTAKNSGYEFSIGGDIIRKKNFTWSASWNHTILKNEITSLYNNGGKAVTQIPGTYNMIEVGKSLNYIWGWKYAGVNTANGNPMYFKGDNITLVQRNISNGTYYTATSMNDNVMTTSNPLTNADKFFLGNSLPTYYGALTNNFKYKNFSLEIMLRYGGGNKILNITRQEALLSMNFHNNGTEILRSWNMVGQVTDVPKAVASQSTVINQTGAAISRFVESGDFIKLQNVVLNYNINNKFLNEKTNGYVRSFRVFVQGQNLATFTKYSGLDPENASQAGQDNAVSPTLRIVSTGVSIGF